MRRIAVFPGSFDPVTKGHESIVNRALELFDELIIAIGDNPDKKTLFTPEQRLKWLKQVFGDYKKVKIEKYQSLTVNFCQLQKANYILRGLRTASDFDFERNISLMNKSLAPEIETVFLLALPEYSALSSSIVRDIYINKGNIKKFMPDKIKF